MPAPTSPEDAVSKGRSLRALDFYEDAVRVLRDADAPFGPTPAVRLETAWNLLMIGEEDITRSAEREDRRGGRPRHGGLRGGPPHGPACGGPGLAPAKLLRYEGEYDLATRCGASSRRASPTYDVHREFADLAY